MNTFLQDLNFTETNEFLIKSIDISFKTFGLKGFIVKIERKPSETNHPQISGDRPLLLAPSSSDRPIKPLISDTFRRNQIKSRAFSLKYDIIKKRYMGEILENIDNYYDYNITNRSRLKPETNRSLISSRPHENILISLSDVDESSRNPINSNSQIMDELSLSKQMFDMREPHESKLLQKLELGMKEQTSNIKPDDGIEILEEKFDYSKGIRVLQLFGNRLYDLDELKKEMDRSSEEEDNEPNEDASGQKQAIIELHENDEEENYEDDGSFFESRKKFKAILDEVNGKSFQTLVIINLVGLLLLIAFLIMNIIYSTGNLESYGEVIDYYNLMLKSSQRIANTQLIFSATFQLMLAGMGYYTYIPNNQSEVWRDELRSALNNLENDQSFLVLNSKSLSSSDYYKLNIVKMNFINNNNFEDYNSSIMFNLNDATQLIIAKTLNVLALKIQDINLQNADTFFILYNTLNDYFIKLISLNDSIRNYLEKLAFKADDLLIVIFIIAIILEFLGLLVLGFFYYIIIKYENQILAIFLEIPITKAKAYFLRCEAFLIQIQQGNEDDNAYDEENSGVDSEDNEEEFKSNVSKGSKMKKRKRSRIKYYTLKKFILKVLVAFSLIEVFFVVDYFSLKTIFDSQISFIPEIRDTMLFSGNLGFLSNSLKYFIF